VVILEIVPFFFFAHVNQVHDPLILGFQH
jgi:hypothetical protein